MSVDAPGDDFRQPFRDDDLDGLDLTPRAGDGTGHAGPPPARRRNPAALVLLGVIAVGVAFVLFQFLSNAAIYYKNADEAVAQREELGDKRFRVQGVVQEGVENDGDLVFFQIHFNGATMDVEHTGTPPQLFEPGIPVVLEGRWALDRDVYLSDGIQIKHSAQYKEDHADRVVDSAENRAARKGSEDEGAGGGDAGAGRGDGPAAGADPTVTDAP